MQDLNEHYKTLHEYKEARDRREDWHKLAILVALIVGWLIGINGLL